MAIFNSYVSLPEGKYGININFPLKGGNCQTHVDAARIERVLRSQGPFHHDKRGKVAICFQTLVDNISIEDYIFINPSDTNPNGKINEVSTWQVTGLRSPKKRQILRYII